MQDITLIGMSDDGCMSLSSRAYNAIMESDLLIGSRRLMEFFPDFRGRRSILKTQIKENLTSAIAERTNQKIAILASGDPMFYGIGNLLSTIVDWERVKVIAQPSSVQLALARIGRSVQDATVISLHGRKLWGLLSRLRHSRLGVILTDREITPQRIAKHLSSFQQAEQWRFWVCEHLGGPDEKITAAEPAQIAEMSSFSALNVCVLERRDQGWQPPPVIGCLPEEEFAKKMPQLGLITKTENRQMALAKLRIGPQSIVWDIGAGSGSIAVEASFLASHGSVYAIESQSDCQEYCQANRQHFGCDNLQVVAGMAPECLDDLPDPDAVFIGGSRGALESIFSQAWTRLRPGGSIVINTVSLENTNEAFQISKQKSIPVDLCLLNVSRGKPLAKGRYLRYEALNPIHLFTFRKPKEL